MNPHKRGFLGGKDKIDDALENLFQSSSFSFRRQIRSPQAPRASKPSDADRGFREIGLATEAIEPFRWVSNLTPRTPLSLEIGRALSDGSDEHWPARIAVLGVVS